MPDVLKKANSEHKLSQLDMTNPNIQIRTYEAGFSIGHDLSYLETRTLMFFKKEAKLFVSALCNYILSNSPLASYLACVACSLYL